MRLASMHDPIWRSDELSLLWVGECKKLSQLEHSSHITRHSFMILAWLKKRNFAFSRVMSPTRTWFIVVAMVLAAVKELQMRAQPTQPHLWRACRCNCGGWACSRAGACEEIATDLRQELAVAQRFHSRHRHLHLHRPIHCRMVFTHGTCFSTSGYQHPLPPGLDGSLGNVWGFAFYGEWWAADSGWVAQFGRIWFTVRCCWDCGGHRGRRLADWDRPSHERHEFGCRCLVETRRNK